MVIATGSSQRHLATMGEHLLARLKAAGMPGLGAEGGGVSDSHAHGRAAGLVSLVRVAVLVSLMLGAMHAAGHAGTTGKLQGQDRRHRHAASPWGIVDILLIPADTTMARVGGADQC